MKQYFSKLIKEFKVFDKSNIHTIWVCLSAVVLQVLGFLWKPFIVFELIFLIVAVSITKPSNSICYLLFLLPFYNVFRMGNQNLQYNEVFANILDMYFSIWVLLAFLISSFVRYVIDLVKKRKAINWKKIIVFALIYI